MTIFRSDRARRQLKPARESEPAETKTIRMVWTFRLRNEGMMPQPKYWSCPPSLTV